MPETCYHCGLDCESELVVFDDKNFCCNGCKTVYEILNAENLAEFYQFNSTPGIKPSALQAHEFDFLKEEKIQNALITFKEGKTSIVVFHIPVIHCTSCVWALENIEKLKKGITSSQVHFIKKTVQIHFNHEELSLYELAIFLSQLGYKPAINLENSNENKSFLQKNNQNLILKIGIAGFCLGNVMLFSFPEYLLDKSDKWFEQYKEFFRILLFLFSLPVVLYCAKDYFKSALKGIQNGIMNMDIPLSLGILVLFGRSIFEAYYDISSGYFDSLCGLIFFMLIGKFFQENTYKSLSFDRDYQSFYPLSITKIFKDKTESVFLKELEIGDRILVRNLEMIPADSILIKGEALIDNSFITGESELISKNVGDKIYAGGKHNGSIVELEIIENVNQSYLTNLWQKAGKNSNSTHFSTQVEQLSKYFTLIILSIAFVAGAYWYFKDTTAMFQVVSAVLIVACPCALSLSSPFTLGNVMRIFGKQKIYCKDSVTIEKLNAINHIILDKTGTLTQSEQSEIQYIGEELTALEKAYIKSLFQNSTHPLSRKIVQYFQAEDGYLPLENFQEMVGKGLEAKIGNILLKAGSASFVGSEEKSDETTVYLSFNPKIKGKFIFKPFYRKGLQEVINQLSTYKITVLSGDNESEKEFLASFFNQKVDLRFNQSPEDKRRFIENLQKNGENIMMIGDGLNDAIALLQSNIGIAITDDVNTFTPASDIILKGESLLHLAKIFKFGKHAKYIIQASFVISFLYNIVGLGFAVTGHLTPLVAAILMPISSISVVFFTTISTWYFGKKYFPKTQS